MNGYNNSYSGYGNDRNGLGALSKALVFIVLLVAALAAVAVIGLMRDPIEDAQAAGMMVGVARDTADLEADKSQMPAISQAEANAQIAQINSEAQTRAVADDVTRRGMIHNQQHQEALDAEALAFSQNMHQIVEWLSLGAGVTLTSLLSLGLAWAFFKEINSRMAVRVAARAAQAAAAQLAAAQAVAAAQAAAVPAAATSAPTTPSPRVAALTGRLPELPTGRPKREPQPPQRQSQPTFPASTAPAPAVHAIPRYAWLETTTPIYSDGVYTNGNGHNSNGHRR